MTSKLRSSKVVPELQGINIKIKAPQSYSAQALFDILYDSDEDLARMRKYMNRPVRKLTIIEGCPSFSNGKATLFDTLDDGQRLSDDGPIEIDKLELKFTDGLPKQVPGDRRIYLNIFIGDMKKHRVSTRLIDLVHRSVDPIFGYYYTSILENVEAGERVKIVLEDPEGAWLNKPPRLEVILSLKQPMGFGYSQTP